MIAKDLIKKLKKCNPNKEVYFSNYEYGWENTNIVAIDKYNNIIISHYAIEGIKKEIK